MKSRKTGLALIIVLMIISGCGKNSEKRPVSAEKVESIKAPLTNTKGVEVGQASIVETEDGIVLSVVAKDLPPGLKGIHIHSVGVCTPPDFKSAGGHFNPDQKEHGFDNPKGFHLGDLPNIEVDADGKAAYKMKVNNLKLTSGSENVLLDADGSAIVIHEDPDDYKTDPSGNSGNRIACAAFQK